MNRTAAWANLLAGLAFLALPAAGDTLLLRGKVVMEDGSPPDKAIGIEEFCQNGTRQVAVADRKGLFQWPMDIDPLRALTCLVRAHLSGYDSTAIDISGFGWSSDPNLPPLVLRRHSPGSGSTDADVFHDSNVPVSARAAWNSATKAAQAKNWAQAERQLRFVVQTAPEFVEGWYGLGFARSQLHKPVDAQEALRQAIARNPKMLSAYLLLTGVSLEAHDWQTAQEAAGNLIQQDTKARYPEAYTQLAMARYQLKDVDGAEASVTDAIRLDKKRAFPENEYVLAVILETKKDYGAAREHFSKYLDLDPKGPDADDARARLPNLGKPGAAAPALALDRRTPDLVASGGEAWVPGGIKALAAVAHLDEVPSYPDFYAKYCRAIANELTVGASRGIPDYTATVRAYLASIVSLTRLGERRGDSTAITLSVATDAARKQTEQILQLLGWKLTEAKDGSFSTEPGTQAIDGMRQQIPAALGIDEISLQEAIEAGRNFQFEIPSENARFIGGDVWSRLLRENTALPPGGIAGALTLDLPLAKSCAGLGTMGPETAEAVMSAVGLHALVTRHADVLTRYGGSFALGKNGVAAPGGVEAEPAWQRLAGVSPRNVPAFFRALVDKDQGKLAAFYSALGQADAAHQRFFTQSPQRAERFFAWYRDGDEFRYGVFRQMGGWQTAFFRTLPLDEAGNVRFPGGKRAWGAPSKPDEEVLLASDDLEALVPLAQLEQQRKAKLEEASAKLLAQHYTEWRPLFPYFASLPSLGAGEFEALAAFADAVRRDPPPAQNAVLGEWYSLLELIDRGVKAGALDGPAAARAFRRVSVDLAADDHSAKALSALRELAGGANLSEAVPSTLLRLTGERRFAFDRVLEMENVPRLEASGARDPGAVLAALTGYVYAASFRPDALLLRENPRLSSKHQFLVSTPSQRRPVLFAASALVRPEDSGGAYLSGGFANFEEIAAGLARASQPRPDPVPESALSPASRTPPVESEVEPIHADFQASGRLVEVYATVTDSRGRYIDGLAADQFTLLEQDNPRKITGFEPQASAVSCVLLLDTTTSMEQALPLLKNASLKLIGELRPEDSVAVYSFSESVTELQPLTTDKAAAKRAVLRTQAFGQTALYDAMARVSQDLAGRAGKKVIVVFSDGRDNASTLTSGSAIARAKAGGVPVYTIAEGEAVGAPALVSQLSTISKATGGQAFVIRNPSEIGRVFEAVSEDLTHGYLLSFPPPPSEDNSWRTIEVSVRPRGAKVRAREGYFPQ